MYRILFTLVGALLGASLLSGLGWTIGTGLGEDPIEQFVMVVLWMGGGGAVGLVAGGIAGYVLAALREERLETLRRTLDVSDEENGNLEG